LPDQQFFTGCDSVVSTGCQILEDDCESSMEASYESLFEYEDNLLKVDISQKKFSKKICMKCSYEGIEDLTNAFHVNVGCQAADMNIGHFDKIQIQSFEIESEMHHAFIMPKFTTDDGLCIAEEYETVIESGSTTLLQYQNTTHLVLYESEANTGQNVSFTLTANFGGE
jgi:hypothetical protein